ncbi:MAG: hypothetical protein A2X94_13860 [Bdellovibrionales bacterium GWB1_55_8]|nr:MAG: hypothetical protein A2X94_13860 [Bdellovibrionales bacterium GWB1_55_8]
MQMKFATLLVLTVSVSGCLSSPVDDPSSLDQALPSGCKLQESIRLSSTDFVNHPFSLQDVSIGKPFTYNAVLFPTTGLKMDYFRVYFGTTPTQYIGAALSFESTWTTYRAGFPDSYSMSISMSVSDSSTNGLATRILEDKLGDGVKIHTLLKDNDLLAIELTLDSQTDAPETICVTSAKLASQN